MSRPAHVANGACRKNSAVRDDSDVVTHALDEVHRVAGDDDGAAGLRVAAQYVFDVGCRNGVDRFEGLIEYQEPGGMDERAGEGHFFRHTRGVVDDRRTGCRSQIHHLQEICGACGDVRAIQPEHHPRVRDELLAGQSVEQPNTIGQVPHHRFGRHGVSPDIDAVDRRRTRIGTQETCRHR